jgi:hypothetical protein
MRPYESRDPGTRYAGIGSRSNILPDLSSWRQSRFDV